MAEKWITLKENVYSGGTIAAPAGEELSPERAYALGVNDDGTVDRTLSTDELRARQATTPGAVPTQAPPSLSDEDLGDAQASYLVSYLAQHPGDVDRVAAVEEARPEPRKTVMEAIERARSGG